MDLSKIRYGLLHIPASGVASIEFGVTLKSVPTVICSYFNSHGSPTLHHVCVGPTTTTYTSIMAMDMNGNPEESDAFYLIIYP